MPPERAFTKRDFRQTASVLPEEKKGALSEIIALLLRRRDQFTNALGAPQGRGEFSKRLIELLGKDAIGDLGVILAGLTRSSGVPMPEQVRGIFDARIVHYQAELQALGGSTREIVKRVLETLDLERYWFGEVFNETERILLEKFFFTNDVPGGPASWKGLDVGSGVGRASLLALEAIQRKYGPEKAARFAQHLHAVDLMPRFVQATQAALAPHGVPEAQVVEGDFLDLPPHLRQGQFHFVWAMMHTLFHCTTEHDLQLALRNLEESMIKGGRLIFDTVGLYHHQGVPNPKTISKFNDLKNLYSVLVRKYQMERIEPAVGQNPSFRVARFPIEDNTALVGVYPREVLTLAHVERVLKTAGSKLRRANYPESRLPFGEYRINQDFPEDKATKLGRQWIKENDLEGWLKREIAYRLEKRDGGEEITPLYALSAESRQEYIPANLARAEIDEILNNVARRMVLGYVQRYYIFVKS